MRSLKVAAVQTVSENGAVRKNLDRAAPLVREAADRGARIILCPEFLPTGYVFSEAIWEGAEPPDGPTTRWLDDMARKTGAYVGTSFLEASGEDFFNTFVLAGPEGEAGRVRKQAPALFEACFFKGEAGPHVIETEFGRVGVGICMENQWSYLPPLLYSRDVDIHLMPHSAPQAGDLPLVPRRITRSIQRVLRDLPESYAKMLGVPVVFANKAGPWSTPLPGIPFVRQESRFPGLSAIADSDGSLLGRLGAEPGMVVGEVTLDPARKVRTPPRTRGLRAFGGAMPVEVFYPVALASGLWYFLNRKRRALAREMSARTGPPPPPPKGSRP